jgi:hypothetical protein
MALAYHDRRAVIGLDWVLRIVSFLAIIVSLYLIAQHQFLVYSLGGLSSISLGSVGALFILSDYSFSKPGGMDRLNSMIFAILFCGGFLWIYEVIYHFSFPITPVTISEVGNAARYLAIAALPILPLVLLRQRLAFTKISAALLSIFILMWVFWFLYGFPQYTYCCNGNWYTWSPILKTSNPWDTSLLFDFGSKTILAVCFASILKVSYLKGVENGVRHLLLSLRHLFLAS